MTEFSSPADQTADADGARFQVAVRIRETGIRRWQAVSLLRPLVERSRALPGCLSSVLYEDLSVTGSILLLQEWGSLDSAQSHLDSGAFEAIRKLTRPEIEVSVLVSADLRD